MMVVAVEGRSSLPFFLVVWRPFYIRGCKLYVFRSPKKLLILNPPHPFPSKAVYVSVAPK